jgi:hypothetical protein
MMAKPSVGKLIEISCFTDILCVWAYVAQLRIDELQAEWQEKIHLQHHFISVFGCTAQRIGEGWKVRKTIWKAAPRPMYGSCGSAPGLQGQASWC